MKENNPSSLADQILEHTVHSFVTDENHYSKKYSMVLLQPANDTNDYVISCVISYVIIHTI
jgi:hypothetical protein